MKYMDLFNYLKEFRKKIAIIIVISILVSIISAITPLISQRMIDEGLVNLNMDVVIYCVILLNVLYLLSQFMEYFQQKLEVLITNSLGKKLKMKVLEHGMKLIPQLYKEKGFYSIIGDAFYGIENVLNITQDNFLIFFVVILKTIGAAIGLYIINWRFASYILLLIPIKYFINALMFKYIEQAGGECLEENKKFTLWFDDIIRGIIDIKLWNLNRKKINEYDSLLDGLNNSRKNITLLHNKNQYITGSVEQLFLNSIYIVGGYLIMGKSLTLGELMTFLTFSSYLFVPVNIILNLKLILKEITPAFSNLKEYFELEEENYSSVIPMNESVECIEFRDVCLELDGKAIVKNLNFKINKKEKVVFVGENGSGKTTILNLLLQIYYPTSGKILFDGKETNQFNISEYRDKFSVVSQDVHLFRGSIKDNIMLDSQSEMEKSQFCSEFIENWEHSYQTQVGVGGTKLSGGERQKIALLRALNKKSMILVLDEATSNYDNKSDQDFNKFISNNDDYEFYFIISHRSEILNYADKVFKICNGEVVEIKSISQTA